MRWLALVVASSACRLGFDPLQVGDDSGVTAPDSSVTTLSRPCGGHASAPDPILITGDVFSYTNFLNGRMSLDDVAIVALADDDSTLATATSDGLYSMMIPSGGRAASVRIRATLANYYTTTTYLDAPLDHDLDVKTSSQWSFGEMPLWSPGSMNAVYAAASEVADPAKGIYNVVVEDCNGDALGGVTVTVDPPPELQVYLQANGDVDHGDVTLTPFSSAVGFNQAPGAAHITATAPGYTFAPVDVVMDSGVGTTMVLMQPII